MITTVHGKPPQQHGWNYRIARQFLCNLRGHIVQGNAGRRKGVIASHGLSLKADCHEARSDAPLDILRCLFPEVFVEGGGTALELRPVMNGR